MENITIDTEFIKLGQALKYANVVESGAVAKGMIQNGQVLVNGKTETRRGKKMYPGDCFEVFNEKYCILEK